MKPVILLDVDGVIGDFVGMICPILNRRFANHRTEADFTHWDLRETLSPAESKYLNEALQQEGIATVMQWYPGAKEFVEELKSIGTVLALTAPYQSSKTWPYERQQWLRREFGLPMLSVPGEHKYLVGGDFLIEDKLITVQQWQDANIRGQAFLLDRPWNTTCLDEEDEAAYFRKHSYETLVSHIRRIVEHTPRFT